MLLVELLVLLLDLVGGAGGYCPPAKKRGKKLHEVKRGENLFPLYSAGEGKGD